MPTPICTHTLSKTVDPTDYQLEITSTYSSGTYVNDGHSTIPTQPDPDGLFRMTINILEDAGGDNIVTHSIDLGNFPFSAENPEMEVLVKEGGSNVGQLSVHQDDADQGERSIGIKPHK